MAMKFKLHQQITRWKIILEITPTTKKAKLYKKNTFGYTGNWKSIAKSNTQTQKSERINKTEVISRNQNKMLKKTIKIKKRKK